MSKKESKLKSSITTLDSIHKIGYKMVQAHENYSMAKKVIIATKRDTINQELKDYIFKDGENPFEEATNDFNKIIQELQDKTDLLAQKEIHQRKKYLGKGKG